MSFNIVQPKAVTLRHLEGSGLLLARILFKMLPYFPMKKNRQIQQFLVAGFLMLIAFAWGVSVVEYKVFPYGLLVMIKGQIRPEKSIGKIPSWNMPHWKMEASLFEELESEPEIVMLGDSITASGEWQELFPDVSIINRGIAKDTTAGLLKRTEEVLKRRPKAVFVLIGINDVGTGVNLESIYTNYTNLVEIFESQRIRVYIQSTILPGRDIEEDQHRTVAELNNKLRLFARTRAATSYIDLNEVLAPEGFLKDDYSLDGVHLNGAAYRLWSNHIAEQVRSVSVEAGSRQ